LNRDIFYAAIGGFGMLGCFTSLTLQLKRVYSGWIEVTALASAHLAEMLGQFEERLDDADYLVGWLDAFAGGRSLGRGQIHVGRHLRPGEDPYPQQSLRLSHQHLPPNLFGVLPRSVMWLLMRPFMNNLGTRLVNTGKYGSSRLGHGKRYRQTHTAFHFLLDYVPDFKKAYGPGGLIQYQSFIPAAAAETAFSDILRRCQKRGLPNYLSVLKRHRPDDFLITHGLDGYSLAMDFRLTPGTREQVAKLTAELDEIVLAAGGRFYFAKDSTLHPDTVARYLGQTTIDRFRTLKAQCDPLNVLQTNLWRRLFGWSQRD
ncbi:MAG: FAD-binding protein, partial [Chloroflexota bacterium]